MYRPHSRQFRDAAGALRGPACAVLFVLGLYFPVRSAWAGVSVGTTAGSFLQFEVGARPAGMAGAQVGSAEGIMGQFWNPASLAWLSEPQVGAMHASWLEGLSYEWLGYASPVVRRWGVGSASLTYFHMPSLNGVDEFGNPTGDFKVYDLAFTAGLARRVVPGVSLGVNGKVIRQTLGPISGTTVAGDLGAVARFHETTVGATLQNFGPSISFDGSAYPLPQQLRFGASREFYDHRVLLAADFNLPRDYYHDIRLGAELRPYEMVALRLGYRRELGSSGDPQSGLSFGLGLHVKQLNVDYAMTPSNEFDNVQRISFGYSFGGGERAPEPVEPEREKPAPPPPAGPKVIARANPSKSGTSTGSSTSPKAVASERVASSSAPAPATQPSTPAAQQTAQAAKPAARGVQYDVVLGVFQSEDGARSELKALEILGFSVKDARINPTAEGGYRLSIARFGSKKSADDLASSLTRMSFQPHVEVVQR